jgi:hypothetical protein
MKLFSVTHARRLAAYTLIEVMAAGTVVAIGATAAVSLTASSALQEEFAHRVAVTRNHQENLLRLWQLGLTPTVSSALMPDMAQNPSLNLAIHSTPVLTATGITTVSGVSMETATCTAVVNISQTPPAKIAGASMTLTGFRQRLVSALRDPTL